MNNGYSEVLARSIIMKKQYLSFYFSAVLSFLVIAFVTFKNGPITSSDGKLYAQWAQVLIAKSFNLKEFYNAVEFFTPLYFYTFTVFLIAILQLISPAEWKILLLCVNLVSIGIIFFCIQVIGRIVSVRSWLMCIALLLFLIGDALLWPAYVLSDTYYAAMVMIIIALMFKEGRKSQFAACVMVFLLMLVRPTAPAILAGVIASIVLLQFSPKNLPRFKLLILFLMSLLATAIVYGIVMRLSITGAIQSRQINFIQEMAAKGLIIHDRPETWLAASTDYLNLVYVFLVRFFSFFKPWVTTFSLLHNLMLFTFISTFCLSVVMFFQTNTKAINNLFRFLYPALCAG